MKVLEIEPVRKRARPQVIDRNVGARIRQQRLLLGLNQQQLAEIIGVTSQQTHKYELGFNRISAGRLYKVAQALDVDINFFFEDQSDYRNVESTSQGRMLLEFVRNVASLKNQQHRAALSSLVRVLADTTARDDSSLEAKPA